MSGRHIAIVVFVLLGLYFAGNKYKAFFSCLFDSGADCPAGKSIFSIIFGIICVLTAVGLLLWDKISFIDEE